MLEQLTLKRERISKWLMFSMAFLPLSLSIRIGCFKYFNLVSGEKLYLKKVKTSVIK